MSPENNIFLPPLPSKFPHIITHILLLVNYTEDVAVFRAVSKCWNDFIQTHLLLKPHMRPLMNAKQRIHAWTKRAPRRTPLQKIDSNLTSMSAKGDHIFIRERLRNGAYKTSIYRNLNFVGFVEDSAYLSCSDLFPCGEFFFRLRHFILVSTLQAYRQREGEVSLQLVPFDAGTRINLRGREILGLKCAGAEDDEATLICVDKALLDSAGGGRRDPSQRNADKAARRSCIVRQAARSSCIVLISLPSGAEKRISVSLVGLDRTLFQLSGPLDPIVMDPNGLVIFWKMSDCLQYIDHANGRELWSKRGVQGYNPTRRSVTKSSELTCIMQSRGWHKGAEMVEFAFYENRTGVRLNMLMTTWRTLEDGHAPFAMSGSTFVWTSLDVSSSSACINRLNVRTGASARMDVSQFWPLSCHRHRMDRMNMLSVVRERVVFLDWLCRCTRNALVVVDLLEMGYSGPRTVDRVSEGCELRQDVAYDGHRSLCLYLVDGDRGRIVCKNEFGKLYEVLDFNQLE